MNYSTDGLIVQDVQKLQQIFQEIDKDCKIIGFEHTKNHIDFLTVKEFVGSQVGSMNLTYPRNWKGPYLQRTPAVNEQQYIILKTSKGHYIVPGDGVALANGTMIGKDFVLDQNSDVDSLLQRNDRLKSSQGALAAKIEIGVKPMQKVLQNRLAYLNFED